MTDDLPDDLDPRWFALAGGTLPDADVDELRALAAVDPAAAQAWEVFAPFDQDFDAEVLRAVAEERRSPRRRRHRQLYGGAGAVLLAAGALLAVRMSAPAVPDVVATVEPSVGWSEPPTLSLVVPGDGAWRVRDLTDSPSREVSGFEMHPRADGTVELRGALGSDGLALAVGRRRLAVQRATEGMMSWLRPSPTAHVEVDLPLPGHRVVWSTARGAADRTPEDLREDDALSVRLVPAFAPRWPLQARVFVDGWTPAHERHLTPHVSEAGVFRWSGTVATDWHLTPGAHVLYLAVAVTPAEEPPRGWQVTELRLDVNGE